MLRFLLALALFFIVANPATFKLTRKVFGGMVASTDGLPTQAGVLLHALVFVLLTRQVGRFVSRYADEDKYATEEYADEADKYAAEEYAEEAAEKYAEEAAEKYAEEYTPALGLTDY